MKSGLALAISGVMALSGSAHALPQIVAGMTLSCPASGGMPEVEVWVGLTETWSEHGIGGLNAGVVLAHVQMAVAGSPERDIAGHVPFEATAFSSCRTIPALHFQPSAERLGEGYEIWRDAIADGAGAFDADPADQYHAILAIRDEGVSE